MPKWFAPCKNGRRYSLALDSMEMSDIVGSLAGDDTALLVMRTTEAAESFCRELKL